MKITALYKKVLTPIHSQDIQGRCKRHHLLWLLRNHANKHRECASTANAGKICLLVSVGDETYEFWIHIHFTSFMRPSVTILFVVVLTKWNKLFATQCYIVPKVHQSEQKLYQLNTIKESLKYPWCKLNIVLSNPVIQFLSWWSIKNVKLKQLMSI